MLGNKEKGMKFCSPVTLSLELWLIGNNTYREATVHRPGGCLFLPQHLNLLLLAAKNFRRSSYTEIECPPLCRSSLGL